MAKISSDSHDSPIISPTSWLPWQNVRLLELLEGNVENPNINHPVYIAIKGWDFNFPHKRPGSARVAHLPSRTGQERPGTMNKNAGGC
jgi:hypothetical protein